MDSSKHIAGFAAALPFWMSFIALPLAVIGAVFGGWWVILLPLYGWSTASLLDAILGLNLNNPPAPPIKICSGIG